MRLARTALCCGILSLGGISISTAQDDPEAEALAALEEALPGTLMNNPFVVDWSTFGDDKRTKVVDAEAVPGGKAYQVRVRKPKRNPWEISVRGPVSEGVAEGDVVLFAFWGRLDKADSGDTSTFQARIAATEAPYAGVAEGDATLSENWQLHYVSGRAGADYAPGDLAVSFNVASQKQTVEFGQYYVMNLGPDADPATLPSGATDP